MERKKASDYPQELLDLFDEYVTATSTAATSSTARKIRRRRRHRRRHLGEPAAQLRLGAAGRPRTTRGSRPST